MAHYLILSRKQEEITDSTPSLYGIEAHELTTSQNSIHTTHNFIIQKISDLIYLVCKSDFFLPHSTKTPQQCDKIFIHFPHFPQSSKHSISYITMTILQNHLCQDLYTLQHTLKDPSVTQQSEEKQYPNTVIPSI